MKINSFIDKLLKTLYLKLFVDELKPLETTLIDKLLYILLHV